MIKSSALTSLLKKVIDNGIEAVFISQSSGEILCMEGNNINSTCVDVASSMWFQYYQVGEESLKNEKLNYLLIENDDSYVIMTYLFSYIICMKSNKNIKLGMLKKHLEILRDNLNKMLVPFKELLIKKIKKDEKNNKNDNDDDNDEKEQDN